MWSTMAMFENYIWSGDAFLKNDIYGVTIFGRRIWNHITAYTIIDQGYVNSL